MLNDRERNCPTIAFARNRQGRAATAATDKSLEDDSANRTKVWLQFSITLQRVGVPTGRNRRSWIKKANPEFAAVSIRARDAAAPGAADEYAMTTIQTGSRSVRALEFVPRLIKAARPPGNACVD